ncbi:arginine N-methyltransferase skb1 [Sodiomyces alkalinus F11]|uniref:Protein arginine N-methyltransferase n=1 Tax=Sodiomyces alkalinus (strain CBS 110278 / VKM F-3762 / F11) TaxID=1314773 RepID=A0A3N2Q9L8_SODAK|nr:arginine N-methyltransferase skb1 [Sodiomyces alkalinus F11]ROT43450.1 arginine N-methyltransferase skb1 [Sodiomyces alkalinus F11]
MMSDGLSEDGGDHSPLRPTFHIGQHDSSREEPLTEMQYGQILNTGVTFVTTPVTNNHFRSRIFDLVAGHLAQITEQSDSDDRGQSQLPADSIVPPLTPKDTALFPSLAVNTYIAYISPWIDLCSSNPTVANISRQVLNLEVAYANFCGVRSIVIPGPRLDGSRNGGNQGISQHGRALQEAMAIGSRLSFLVHVPMYREPGLEVRRSEILSHLAGQSENSAERTDGEIDIYSTWDSWHTIRTICDYSPRLFVALRIPRVLPEREVQEKWFAEPLHYLTLGPETFQKNKAGHPALPRTHQDLLFSYMRLKNAPWLLLCDVGPDLATLVAQTQLRVTQGADFPSLQEAAAASQTAKSPMSAFRDYVVYLKWLETQQPPLSYIESTTLASFQDWLQSPLQPLSDNLESATYEVFEGDPVKYNQYEAAIVEALAEWKDIGRSYSSANGSVVIAVVGSGRGPLVTRALKASEKTGVPVQVWAVEKNPNAYVFLLHQKELIWEDKVTVVKTDMRSWKGPLVSGTPDDNPVYGKVDILVSELLGSFGDNELSPECLDGVQHVLAPHGISIPESYTAHMTPIATPRIHADLLSRAPTDPNGFETPWVVHLFAMDFAAAERVPGHPRFQQAWEFQHPIPDATLKAMEARRSGGVMGGGGGSMAGAAGANDHNSRFCHLTFVCRTRGVIHGLAGYFESVLYAPRLGNGRENVEISTHPDFMDKKSKDMVSWFPIFFPIKRPLYYPADTELEVTMWRQTDDTKVWYEWLVEAYTWVSETQRIKVGASELCSSRKVGCLM